MNTAKKILAVFLLAAFIGGTAGCAASKCNCPKFSLEANDILE